MKDFGFIITKKIPRCLGRAGEITTPHGVIQTPAFTVVGTKATVKSLSPEQVSGLGAYAVLANTYHLYLEPGEKVMKQSGGLGKFMNWSGPTLTDSGGFQVFSLGVDFDKKVGKIKKVSSGSVRIDSDQPVQKISSVPLAKIDEDGVTFRSVIDGSSHRFTPERSIEIQHAIGADIIFAFDECTSPDASYEYQKEALDRTHRWASRSLTEHKRMNGAQATPQALFGIVQGGRFADLRKESAHVIGKMDFDGFGIGGSFDEHDIASVVGIVNTILPEGKPRHLLGIGDPLDLFAGVEQGCDTFDCVAPTRIARNGALYTRTGRVNILNARFVKDSAPIDATCACYTCTHYTRSYVAHLFRANEMFGATLASIHNLYFIVNLLKEIREAILSGTFAECKARFEASYKK